MVILRFFFQMIGNASNPDISFFFFALWICWLQNELCTFIFVYSFIFPFFFYICLLTNSFSTYFFSFLFNLSFFFFYTVRGRICWGFCWAKNRIERSSPCLRPKPRPWGSLFPRQSYMGRKFTWINEWINNELEKQLDAREETEEEEGISQKRTTVKNRMHSNS